MLRIVVSAAVSVAALAAVAGSAAAADLPMYEPAPASVAPSMPSTWTGAQVGAQIGYGWGKSKNRPGADTKPEGGLVGAYAGYNYQFDNSPVVIGADTDINYNNADDRRRGVRNDLNWSGATRGKVGYAFGNAMVYGAAGAAYGGLKVRQNGVADSKTSLGYTVGGGLETMLTENVTARAEYRYNDYGKEKVNGTRTEMTENRVTGGVAYKFSGW